MGSRGRTLHRELDNNIFNMLYILLHTVLQLVQSALFGFMTRQTLTSICFYDIHMELRVMNTEILPHIQRLSQYPSR